MEDAMNDQPVAQGDPKPADVIREALRQLEHFLDLDNPYLGEDQRVIGRGIKARKAALAALDELEDHEQAGIDAVVYYRNLAVMRGATPNEMRNDFDRGIAERGITSSEHDFDPFDDVAEHVEDWTTAALLARAEVAEAQLQIQTQLGADLEAQLAQAERERDMWRDANKANVEMLVTAEKQVQHRPDVNVTVEEVADKHSRMPFASPHSNYRQRHDAGCYFCALLTALAQAREALARIASMSPSVECAGWTAAWNIALHAHLAAEQGDKDAS